MWIGRRPSQIGLTQRDVTSSMLISLSGSGTVAPNFWMNWTNGVSYNVGVQTPQYRIDSLDALLRTPDLGRPPTPSIRPRPGQWRARPLPGRLRSAHLRPVPPRPTETPEPRLHTGMACDRALLLKAPRAGHVGADYGMILAERVPLAGKAVGALNHHARNPHRGGEMGGARIEPDQQTAAREQCGGLSDRKTPGGMNRLALQIRRQEVRQTSFRGSAQDHKLEQIQTQQPASNLEETLGGPGVSRLLTPRTERHQRPPRVHPTALQPPVDRRMALGADRQER